MKGYQFTNPPPSPGEGLLFVFNNEESHQFHMNNVGFDLDLLGFDRNGCLVCNIPMKSGVRILYKTPPVKFVVEAPSGWSNSLMPGESLLRIRRIV